MTYLLSSYRRLPRPLIPEVQYEQLLSIGHAELEGSPSVFGPNPNPNPNPNPSSNPNPNPNPNPHPDPEQVSGLIEYNSLSTLVAATATQPELFSRFFKPHQCSQSSTLMIGRSEKEVHVT